PIADRNQLARFDGTTGEVFPLLDSLGDSPGPVAQDPADDGVYYLNRGLRDPSAASLVHLSFDSKLVCQTPVPAPAVALALGPGGVWAARSDPAELRVFSPSCTQIGDVVALPTPIAALAIDPRGILWTASPSDRSVRLDTTSGATQVIQHSTPTREVAVGADGAIWFAGAPAHR